MTTTKTYGDWHDLSEAIPGPRVTEVEAEYEDGARACVHRSCLGHPGHSVVRWRTVREHRPDANGWFRRGEGDAAAWRHVLVRFDDGAIVVVVGDWMANNKVEVTHWKPIVLPEGVER